MHLYKQFTLSIVFISLLLSCSDSTSSSSAEQLYLESGELVASAEKTVIAKDLIDLSDGAIPENLVSLFARNDVDMYRITYKTTSINGDTILASGTLSYPSSSEQKVSILSYQHGTVFEWDDVTSELFFNGLDGLLSQVAASMGFAVASPDYVGYGISKGEIHPFVHHKSLGIQNYDFLMAVQEFLKKENLAVNDSLFLMGYSEGGYATVSLQKTIEETEIPNWSLIASAAGGAPLDLSGVMKSQMLESDSLAYPAFLSLALKSYSHYENVWSTSNDYLNELWADSIQVLLNGEYSGGEINKGQPSSAQEILKSDVYAALTDGSTHSLVTALESNDLYNWKTKTPLHLYHCIDDEVVPFENSQKAFDSMSSLGSNVTLDTLNTGGHVECGATALLASIQKLLIY